MANTTCIIYRYDADSLPADVKVSDRLDLKPATAEQIAEYKEQPPDPKEETI